MNGERWLPVVGWEGVYSVSDRGRVRSESRVVRRGEVRHPIRERILKAAFDRYLSVVLCRDGRPFNARVHRLVLEAFRGKCPAGMEARHFDGDGSNAALSNLFWGTPIENAADRERHGTQRRGSDCQHAKLTPPQVLAIRADARKQRDIAAEYGVTQTAVSRIKLRKIWAALP